MPVRIHHHGRYLSLLERDGWEYASRENCSGVAVLIAVTPDDELLLVEQYRVPLQQNVIELPAGLSGDGDNAGESVLDAAGRELQEETGYRAGSLRQGPVSPISAGLSDELVTFVFATELEQVGPGGGDDSEDIRVHPVPLAGIDRWLEERMAAGALVESKIFAALYWLSDRRTR